MRTPVFPGNYRHFPSPRRVCGVVNLGGVVKTLRRSNFTIFAIAVVFLVRKGPLGLGSKLGVPNGPFDFGPQKVLFIVFSCA